MYILFLYMPRMVWIRGSCKASPRPLVGVPFRMTKAVAVWIRDHWPLSKYINHDGWPSTIALHSTSSIYQSSFLKTFKSNSRYQKTIRFIFRLEPSLHLQNAIRYCHHCLCCSRNLHFRQPHSWGARDQVLRSAAVWPYQGKEYQRINQLRVIADTLDY